MRLIRRILGAALEILQEASWILVIILIFLAPIISIGLIFDLLGIEFAPASGPDERGPHRYRGMGP